MAWKRRRNGNGADHLVWRRWLASVGGQREADGGNCEGLLWMKGRAREREREEKEKSLQRKERGGATTM